MEYKPCVSPSESQTSEEIQRLLRFLSEGKTTAGSYAANMSLKRLQERKNGMERLFQLLETRIQALEIAENQVESRLLTVKSREAALEKASNKRIIELEAELAVTNSLLAQYRVQPEVIEASRSLVELQRTAEMLEKKTRELIVKERDLDRREKDLQQKTAKFNTKFTVCNY